MRFPRGFRDAVYMLDRLSPILAQLRASTIHQTSRSFVGRFCAVIPKALVPLAIPHGKDLYLRASIEPNSVIYVHENVVIISQSRHDGGDLFRALLMGDRVPAIDLDRCGDDVMSVLAASIADAIAGRDRWKEILSNLPSNLRALVSKAVEQLEEANGDDLIAMPLRRASSFIEVRLWSYAPGSRPRDNLHPYEISFVKSVGPGYVKMKFLGLELDLRPSMPAALEHVMAKLVDRHVIDSIVERVYRAARIVGVGLSLAR
ncbi:MAG: hypothetical protein GXO32_05920 [Crenarchaeota archaeon]|nr:hypothetical protein [Thermoproteota archaeon]